ncbi:MAG: hypothetical protein KDA99_21095 [Planctomycetales bacterium]|nr:hypothetical protein [Planctomycetales bacterium]
MMIAQHTAVLSPRWKLLLRRLAQLPLPMFAVKRNGQILHLLAITLTSTLITVVSAVLFGSVPRIERAMTVEQKVDIREELRLLDVSVFVEDNMTDLRMIDVSSIRDRGLLNDAVKLIAQLSYVGGIDLNGLQVMPQHLRAIGQCRPVRTLVLQGTPTTDEDLVALTGLTELQELDLSETQVTSRGLSTLTVLAELETLDLSECQVGSNLSALRLIPRLKALSLKKTNISDRELVGLAELEHLQVLSLFSAQYSESALDELLQKRPELHVRR